MNRKKGLLTGWKTVFGFTVKQTAGGKGFRIVTILIGCIAFFGLSLINIIVALVNSDQSDHRKSEVDLTMETVYVCDETGMFPDISGWSDFVPYPEEYGGIEITQVSETAATELIQEYIGKDEAVVVLQIREEEREEDKVFQLELLIPEGSRVTEESGEEFLSLFSEYFESVKFMSSGITPQQLVHIITPVYATVSQVGEKAHTIGEFLVENMAPMLFSLLFYMMLLLYGQSISKSVISEKTSKLMETMLTTVRPYAIITGKVLGMAAIAIAQLFLWIFLGMAGFLMGDMAASKISSNYENVVLQVIRLIRENAGHAFSVPAVFLFLVTMCIGFVMYCVFAALAASGAKRAEELNNSMAMYNFVVIIGFVVSYFVPMQGNPAMAKILNYIPPIAVFKLPVDILLGSISYGNALICTALVILTMFVLVIVTGKIYKKKVF